MRNPFTAYPVSQGWSATHPAVDYATPVGVEFTAPASGVYIHRPSELTRTPGAAGIYGDLILDDGRRIRVCHLSRHIAPSGSRVVEGRTVLAVTGNTGYVKPTPTPTAPSAGAHMHTTGFHADGTRWNWTLATDDQGEEPMLADERNAILSVHQAVFVGGGDAGDKSIISRLIDLENRPAATVDYDKLADAIFRRAMTSQK